MIARATRPGLACPMGMRLVSSALLVLSTALLTTGCGALLGVDFEDKPGQGDAATTDGGTADGGGVTSNDGQPDGGGAAPMRLTSVATGGSFACAVLSSGDVTCWGRNNRGQLGAGGKDPVLGPARVVGLPAPAIAVAAAGEQACAVLTSQQVACWGANGSGQLGDGTKSDQATAKVVVGLTGAVQVRTSGETTCARLSSGGVKCWGRNDRGQLGDGSGVASTSPVDVQGLSRDVIDLEAGGDRTCALLAKGAVKCWGLNDSGQLEPSKTDQKTPYTILGDGSNVVGLAVAWLHTCVLASNGGVLCRGYNGWGALGDGTFNDLWTWGTGTPFVSALGADVAEVQAQLYSSCAIRKSSREVWCWGGDNWGQLGDGALDNRATPKPVSGLPAPVKELTVGGSFACAIVADGAKLFCWGDNDSGQLGSATEAACTEGDHKVPCSSLPLEVKGLF